MEVIITYLMIRVIRNKILDKLSVDRRVGDGRYAIPGEQALCARSFIARACILFHSRQCRYLPHDLQPALHLYKAAFSIDAPSSLCFSQPPSLTPSLLRSSPFIYSSYRVTLLSTRTSHPRQSQYPSETRILSRGAKERTPVGRATQSGTQMEYIFCFIRKRLANLSICNVSRRSCTPNRIDLLHL